MTGPLVWFVVGLIVIPFAFFGIESFRGGGADPTVAKVGDQKITQSQFRAAYDQRISQLQAMMGENFRPDLIDTARFRQAVLDDMVQELLLRQHVQGAGYRAPDAVLFEALQGIPAFRDNGRFSTETYRNRLAMQGLTPARFEKQMREALMIEQMREGILATSFVGDAAVAQAYRVEDQKRALYFATFEVSDYVPRVHVDDQQVREHYEQHRQRFQAPERMRAAYVELSLDKLPPAEKPAEEVLRVLYEADKATRFSTPEERRARHILISFGADRDAARARLESVAGKVRKGADFASLAQSHSEDPGSKEKGGDLGWVRRGQMTEKFEQALFSLKAGEVSEAVETEFGWHLIRLDDVRPATTRAFEEPAVQAELLRLYRRRDAERRYQELSEKLEQISFESPSSLDPAAKALGTEIQTTDWFTRAAGKGIAAAGDVREAAFSADVLQNEENSRVLPVGDNHVVVLRKEAYEAPRQKPLEEVADGIRQQLRLEAARTRARDDAAAALAAVREGASLERVAREHGAAFRSAGLVTRDQEGIDGAVLGALFRLPRPSAGGVAASSVALPNGDAAVVVTNEVQHATWPPATDEAGRRGRARLREAAAGAEFAAYRADLQRRTEVKIVAPPESPDPEPAE